MAQNDYFVIGTRVLTFTIPLKRAKNQKLRFSLIDVQYPRKLLDIHSFKLD